MDGDGGPVVPNDLREHRRVQCFTAVVMDVWQRRVIAQSSRRMRDRASGMQIGPNRIALLYRGSLFPCAAKACANILFGPDRLRGLGFDFACCSLDVSGRLLKRPPIDVL